MKKIILVTGDVFVDHHVYEGERLTASATKHRGMKVIRQHGGAVGLTQLINAVFQSAVQVSEKPGGNDTPEKSWAAQFALTTPELNSVPCGHHALAVWKQFPKEAGGKCEKNVWRAGLLMGYGHDEPSTAVENEFCPRHIPAPLKNLPAANILVLDDAGFVFRQRELENCWLLSKSRGKRPDWIVLKMSGPVCAGDLWERLSREQSARLVVVVSAHELRQECVRLGKGLSWERTVEELREALLSNPVLLPLITKTRHLIVTFSADGALWLDNSGTQPKATLIYDAASVEGTWAQNIKGDAFGYLSCMVAAVIRCLATDTQQVSLSAAIASGLSAMRDLRKTGHGPVGKDAPTGFPMVRLAETIVCGKTEFSEIRVPWIKSESTPFAKNPEIDGVRRAWRMVESSQCPFGSTQLPSLTGLATQLILSGERAIRRLPHARFGKYLTADRFEIEALHSIKRQLSEFNQPETKVEKPLSVGVFGPPGAGKSFAVKQIAHAIFGKEAWLEFNLSQFRDVGDLIGAFHQVRDKVLSGATPVVFWDEFDSREYSWLQYLLAPMQDGRFQEGQVNHYIGKCVFIFAGATSYTFAEFGPEKPGSQNYDDVAWKKFKLCKGPDFHSRLDAYFDVLGPNQRTLPLATAHAGRRVPDRRDVCAPLRRALLIRALFGVSKDARLDFDADLLNALLSAPGFTHGARSLEKLVLSLKPSDDEQPIRRSSLPPASVLAMHLDKPDKKGKSFEQILNQDVSFKNSSMIEAIAKAIHEAWLPFAAKDNPFNRPWAKLLPPDREDSFAAARRIPEVLALAGLSIKAGRSAAETKIVSQHIEHHLERLAEAEHDGWMNHRLKNGWRWDDKRDDSKKCHPLLKPYAELPEIEKAKDRRSVSDYQRHVHKAGYKIVFA